MRDLATLSKIRVEVYYEIGEQLLRDSSNKTRNYAANTMKLTQGQIGLCILLAKHPFSVYKDCINLSECKLASTAENDRKRSLHNQATSPSAEIAEETVKRNFKRDYDRIDY